MSDPTNELPEDIGAVDPDDPPEDIETLPAEEQLGDDEGSDDAAPEQA